MELNTTAPTKKSGTSSRQERKQFSTFAVAGRLYGIDVRKVQEIVKPMPITRVPLAKAFVRGLINLRGQIATAVDLRELFGLVDAPPDAPMNVVCRNEGELISLVVDDIGDVIEVDSENYEDTPKTIAPSIRDYMTGVYKLQGTLLSIIDIDKLFTQVSK